MNARLHPVMRAASAVALLVFAGFTALQFNDLEQYGTRLWFGWVVVYGGTAAISAVSFARPLATVVYAGWALVALAAALVRATSINWYGSILHDPSNPAGNETGGLLIVALWLAALAAGARVARGRGR